MEKRFTAEELPESQWSIWDKWLMELPYASPFSMSWWLETVCDVFGGKPHVFVVTAHDNSIVGGIALREISFLGKSIVSPSTLSLYMPVVLSESLNRHDIVDILTELARFLMNRFDVIHGVHNTKEISDIRPFQWLGYQVDVRYTAVTELTTYDFNLMDRSQRKQIKKAERAGLVTRPCGDVAIMWDLWSKTFERQGLNAPVSLPEFRRLIDTIWNYNSGLAFVTFQADGAPTSFRLCVFCNVHTAYDWIAGNDPTYFSVGAPSFNVWSSLNYLKAQGFSTFDWCGANIKSIAEFKLSFGAKLVPYFGLELKPWWFEPAFKCRSVFRKATRRR